MPTLVIASLGSLHCAEREAPVTATIALRADLPGASTACFRMEFRDAPSEVGDARGALSAVKMLCGVVDERGVFAAQTEVACDGNSANSKAWRAGSSSKRVRVNFGTAQTDWSGDWADPCGATGCEVDLTCGGATELDFVMANEETRADWTNTQVAMRDGWFGAKLQTCNEDEPLVIGGRDRVAVFAFTGATIGDTQLSLAVPQIVCEGGTTCVLAYDEGDAYIDATCSDGSVVPVRSYIGIESTFAVEFTTRYANLLVDLADLIDNGNTRCELRHAATVSDGPLALGPHMTYPVASVHAQLIDDDGELECIYANFDDYGREDDGLLSIGHLRGEALAPGDGAWSDEVPSLCYTSTDAGLTSRCP